MHRIATAKNRVLHLPDRHALRDTLLVLTGVAALLATLLTTSGSLRFLG